MSTLVSMHMHGPTIETIAHSERRESDGARIMSVRVKQDGADVHLYTSDFKRLEELRDTIDVLIRHERAEAQAFLTARYPLVPYQPELIPALVARSAWPVCCVCGDARIAPTEYRAGFRSCEWCGFDEAAVLVEEVSCIVCDCTDSFACEDGCSWLAIDREAGVGVCSSCAANAEVACAMLEQYQVGIVGGAIAGAAP